MKPQFLAALFCGFVIVNVAPADSSRACGQDTLSKNTTVCFRYYPGRALELSSPGKKVEYTVSKENSPREYGSDLIVDRYAFEPAVKGSQIVMKIRIVEPARYPGDGEYEMLSLEGTTPDGVKFFVAKPK